MTDKPLVLVTTKHRGVFVGRLAEGDVHSETVALDDAYMIVRWRHGKGVLGVAETGVGGTCKVSAKADIPSLRDVTMVAAVTPEAYASIEKAAP